MLLQLNPFVASINHKKLLCFNFFIADVFIKSYTKTVQKMSDVTCQNEVFPLF